jgi:hypothetical protein
MPSHRQAVGRPYCQHPQREIRTIGYPESAPPKRLGPRILDELKKFIPKNETGRRKAALSQGLTRNIGYPKLRVSLGAVVAYMSVSKDYKDFIQKLDRFRPRLEDQYELPFNYSPEEDSGEGI